LISPFAGAPLIKDPLNEDDEEGLGEDELKILRDASILKSSRKASSKQKPQHIVFAESAEEARQFSQKPRLKPPSADESTSQQPKSRIDLGWKSDDPKRKSRKSSHTPKPSSIPQQDSTKDNLEPDDLDTTDDGPRSNTSTKRRLLKELSARLRRDTQLRYAQREFEMQRLLMGKGARKKIAGVEKVNGDSESEEDEDEIDARKGRPRNSIKKVDEETYKPRVYKWKMERKR